MYKKSITFFLTLAISFCCSGIAAAAKDTLVIGHHYDATTFDPHKTSDIGSQNAMVQIYDPLMKVDENGKLVPHLAESAEQIDELTYKFTLRRGVKFHNGETLSASDVKFTLLRAINEGQAINYVVANIDPEGIEILDDYTIVIKIKKPDASFLAYMAHYGGTCVLNEKAVRESGDDYGTKPIGTGPYKFVSWVKGDRITLIRNDDYWGEPAKIKNIVIRPIAEATNRTIEMETGGVDLAFSIQPLDMGRIESNPKLKLMRNRDTTIYTVGMNTEKKPLDDIRVRRAISLAIDANALNKAVYRGIGTVGRSIVPPTIPYYDEDSPEHEYSPEKAKQLLAEAGYDNGLKLTLVSNENKERIDTMTIVQNMLGKVGIESEIQVIEWGVYLDKLVQGEYDLCTGGWSCSVFDPDEAVYGQYHSSEIEVGYNWVRLRDAKTDELIEEGRATADKTKRAAIYKALQDRIRELYPVVVTQSGEALIAMSAELKGVSPNALDLFDFCKAYFE